MMSLLDIRRAILESQPAAVNRIARSLQSAFLREAGTDRDWRDIARHHFHAMAAGALIEERALGEERAMAFVADALAPIARRAPLYRMAREIELAELADLVAGFGSDRLDAAVLRHAAERAREAALRTLSRFRESAADPTSHAASRDARIALRRFFCAAAPALRLELATDASRWIASQDPGIPLSTLAQTPYEEMLPREMDLLRRLVSGYLEEMWFRDRRYGTLFAKVPKEYWSSLEPAFGAGHDDWLLRCAASALLVSPLERLDLLDQDGADNGRAQIIVSMGRRIADWAERLVAADVRTDMKQPWRAGLEGLHASHGVEIDALLLDLRERCENATSSV